MSNNIDILVPDLPESVIDATVITWHKKPGDSVQRDEVLVDIETDKVVLEIPSPETGILEAIVEKEGTNVSAGQLIGILRTLTDEQYNKSNIQEANIDQNLEQSNPNDQNVLSPAIRRLIAKHDLQPHDIIGSANGGRITREDVEAYISTQHQRSTETEIACTSPLKQPEQTSSQIVIDNYRIEKRVPMSRMRKRIAERLLEAKNSTAMLTTFNEVNMKSVIELRQHYGQQFEKRHGIRLGFMSFYVKAVLESLKQFPEINAYIDNDDVVYHEYFDISIAVTTPRGLVTPVLKDVNKLSMANIEKQIRALSIKGRDGTLKVEELIGGNFTITNGGIFGSLMSTPIINPPQSAILGMHTIKDRPMAIDGQVVILPMMYLALSYDHRLIDGKEAVSFLVTVKDLVEDPIRLLLDV